MANSSTANNSSESQAKFSDIYPAYDVVNMDYYGEPNTEYYYVRVALGGRDENGEFLLVQDGPAKGEKVYLNE